MADAGDQRILDRIHELMAAEHELLEAHPHPGRDGVVDAQLAELEVEIDQQWDLLRQRRALRRAGDDPEAARLRGPGTVEGYQQ
jgi:hypothetical protein